MEIHHTKHHQTYITNLNNALQGTDLGNQSIESLVAKIEPSAEIAKRLIPCWNSSRLGR